MLSSYGRGNSNSLSRHTSSKIPVIKIKDFVKSFGHLSLKMILVLFCVGPIVQAVISDKFLQDGDIETNPRRTHNIERVVQGSFHQGNKELFGKIASIQGACNSLYALRWVKIKQIFHWGKSNLDHNSFLRDVFRENANNASTTLSLLFIKGFATAIISSGNCY